jgi:hypothetical protein
MYLIAPTTIIFIGAEMRIDPALLSAIGARWSAHGRRRLAGRRHLHQGYKGTKRRWPRRRAYFSFWESSGSAWQHGLAAFDFVAMPEVSHALRHKTPQLSKCKLTTANLATPCLGTIVHQYLGSYRDNR